MFLELFNSDHKMSEIFEEINLQFQNDYIPAIVDENKSTIDENGNYLYNELYGKLILIKKDKKVDHTWMIDNLEYKSIFYDEKDIYNLIIKKKYQNRKIYSINYYLLDEDSVVEYPSDDLDYANLKYVDEDEYRLLYSKGDNLYLYNKFLDRFLDEYDLWWEFEYINSSEKKVENITTDNCFIEVINDEKGAYIRGTVKLKKEIKVNEIKRNIKVWDYISKSQKEYNPNNYNDDAEINFLILNKDAIEFLRQEFLLYGIWMYDKKNSNTFVVDIHDDYILLLEGNYNSMSMKQKNSLEKYCMDTIPDNINISKCFEDSQLLSSWDAIDDYGTYTQKLGTYLYEKWKDNVFDKKISFFEPTNLEELNKTINGISEIIQLSKDKQINIEAVLKENINFKEMLEKICEIYFGEING